MAAPPLSVRPCLLKVTFFSLNPGLPHDAPLVPKMKLVFASVSYYIMYLELVLAAVHMKPAMENRVLMPTPPRTILPASSQQARGPSSVNSKRSLTVCLW